MEKMIGSGSAPCPLAYLVTIAKKFKIYILHSISLRIRGVETGAATLLHAGATPK
jgi:hypothetical protein